MHIGFDLDGVLVADYLDYADSGQLTKKQILQQAPLFKPVGKFYIITGREAEVQQLTEKWLLRNKIMPIKLFHGNEGQLPGREYKAQVLLDNPQITTFVESSISQVRFYKKLLKDKCEVIHFSTWLTRMLQQEHKLRQKGRNKLWKKNCNVV